MLNIDLENLIKLIKENLSDDLLKSKYIKFSNKNKLTGHCYIASEALYYLNNEIYNNYKPAYIKINNDTHWFLKNINTGHILDITKEQFNFKLEYLNIKNASFLTNYPSKRCKILIHRIKNMLHQNLLNTKTNPMTEKELNLENVIYCIKNKINNKIYIGQTIRPLKVRIYEYKRTEWYDKKYANLIYKAIKKYGFDNFEFSIIDTAETIDELNEKEINYIKLYDSTNKKIGYNQHIGGRNGTPNEETLQKMSKAHKGLKQSKEWVEKRIPKAGSEEAKKHGRPKTEQQKKELSEKSPKFWLGKNRSEETKRKIAETKLNNGCLDKYKKLYSKKVYIIDTLTNKLINSFESTKIAGENLKLHQSTVSERCKYNMIVKGILYTYNNPDQ